MNSLTKRWTRGALVGGAATSAVVLAIAATAYACGNFVGVMKVYGNISSANTVTVTGSASFDAPEEAMTQSVSATQASAENDSTGNFYVWTGPRSDNGWKLAAGTYDVNWLNLAYTSHTQWGPEPDGMCMDASTSTPLGTVTIDSNGNISAGSGSFFISYSAAWAKFDLPTASANANNQESGVCIAEPSVHNGNQAPLKLF